MRCDHFFGNDVTTSPDRSVPAALQYLAEECSASDHLSIGLCLSVQIHEPEIPDSVEPGMTIWVNRN